MWYARGVGERPINLDAGRSERLVSIDLLRGLVIVLMALDHARDYYGLSIGDPLDLATTTPLLFMTRWVTHFCAPVFVFLAGTGAYLWGSRGKSRAQVAAFLLTRGVWLVFLELTLVRWGWFVVQIADVDYSFVFVQVIWALGWSMIVLSVLVFLPPPLIGALGVAMIAGHNAFDWVDPADLGAFGGLWRVLHVQGPVPYRPGGVVYVQYPLVPWIGVMAAGYAFGRVMQLAPGARQRICAAVGIAMVVGFVSLRLWNGYGDPSPWSREGSFSTFSFLNTTKYPPSLDYLLMTLGPALVVLGVLDRLPRTTAERYPGRVFLTFGRVPLFFYVLHLYLLQLGAIVYMYARYGERAFTFGPNNLPADGYIGLAPVYLAWACVVAALYPVCRWFATVKARRREWWLAYL